MRAPTLQARDRQPICKCNTLPPPPSHRCLSCILPLPVHAEHQQPWAPATPSYAPAPIALRMICARASASGPARELPARARRNPAGVSMPQAWEECGLARAATVPSRLSSRGRTLCPCCPPASCAWRARSRSACGCLHWEERAASADGGDKTWRLTAAVRRLGTAGAPQSEGRPRMRDCEHAPASAHVPVPSVTLLPSQRHARPRFQFSTRAPDKKGKGSADKKKWFSSSCDLCLKSPPRRDRPRRSPSDLTGP